MATPPPYKDEIAPVASGPSTPGTPTADDLRLLISDLSRLSVALKQYIEGQNAAFENAWPGAERFTDFQSTVRQQLEGLQESSKVRDSVRACDSRQCIAKTRHVSAGAARAAQAFRVRTNMTTLNVSDKQAIDFEIVGMLDKVKSAVEVLRSVNLKQIIPPKSLYVAVRGVLHAVGGRGARGR